MELEVLLDRLHQINAVDKNALAIYTDMLTQVEDPRIVNILKRLVQDEAKHVRLEKELISFLERKS